MAREYAPRICANEHCGKEFVPHSFNQLTCSEACRLLYKAQKATERYYKWKAKPGTEKPPRIRACAECGKEFDSGGRWNATICSPACRRKRKNRQMRESIARNDGKVRRKCEQCGTEFYAAGENRFCSSKCRGEHTKQMHEERRQAAINPAKAKKKTGLTGKALMQAQGVMITGKTDLQIAEEARAAGMSAGKYRALLQLEYEREKGIGFYAN